MNSSHSFSADYAGARTLFRSAVVDAGGALEQRRHPEPGPDGGELFCDVAWFGPRHAERVLVTVSGTHGIEGFGGSGAQVDWLRRGEASRLPADVAVLMIHAINPYGFAWLRRVTHENVDLNRNWLDFAQPLPPNPGYDELADALCPPQWTDESRAASGKVLGAFHAREGAAAFQKAISGGQARHPNGIFYSGTAPTWSRQTQASIFHDYLGQAGRVGLIDYHTGLGPWGVGEQILAESRSAPSFKRAASWYGAALTSIGDGSSTSSALSGDGLSAAPTVLAHAEVTCMALEIGTLPIEQVLAALRAEAWLHFHGDRRSELGRSIEAQMRAAFYGDADDWKGMVAGQSLLACKQAIAGLRT